MTRLLSPIVRGGLLCAFAFGAAACSDGNGLGSQENGRATLKPNDTTTQPSDQTKADTGHTTGTTDTAGGQQNLGPVKKIDKEVVGFHIMKDDPSMQMTAYHYCDKLPSGVMQCVLFSDDTAEAKMLGLEFIISKDKFDALSADEKKLWHPHNYEILSGQLVAPGMSDEQELAMMTELMNSYGKTYQFMNEGDDAPKGEPKLAWSINHDGELKQNLMEERDQKLGVDTKKKAEARQSLQAMAQEQEGVNAIGASGTSGAAAGEGGKGQSSMDQTPQQQAPTDETKEPAQGDQTSGHETAAPVKGGETAAPVKGQQGGQMAAPVKGQQGAAAGTASEPTKGQSIKGEQPHENVKGQQGAMAQDQSSSSQVKDANVKGAK